MFLIIKMKFRKNIMKILLLIFKTKIINFFILKSLNFLIINKVLYY